MRWVELDWLHDAEILGPIGRHPLTAILDLLAPALAQQGVTLPDLRLPVKGSTHSLDSAEKPPFQPTFVILAIGYGDASQTSGIGPGLHVPTLIRHFLW
jgi:hypothetical protein